MKANLRVALASLCLGLFASQAMASTVVATVNFTSNASGTSGLTGLFETTFSTSATYTSAAGVTTAAQVTTNANGLGVRSPGDEARNQAEGLEEIDGFPLGTTETLTVTFSDLVYLSNIVFGTYDPDDDFEFAPNGGTIFAPVPARAIGTQFGLAATFQILAPLRSFTIRVSGNAANDGSGDDGFTIRSVTISVPEPGTFPPEVGAVPLPAGGGLLLAGLAVLAFLRRRKAG